MTGHIPPRLPGTRQAGEAGKPARQHEAYWNRRKMPVTGFRDDVVPPKKTDVLDAPQRVALEDALDAVCDPPSLDLISDVATLTKFLSRLTPREERVIRLHFGIGVPGAWTLEEIGAEFGIGGQRIGQIKNKAIRKLRGQFNRQERAIPTRDIKTELAKPHPELPRPPAKAPAARRPVPKKIARTRSGVEVDSAVLAQRQLENQRATQHFTAKNPVSKDSERLRLFDGFSTLFFHLVLAWVLFTLGTERSLIHHFALASGPISALLAFMSLLILSLTFVPISLSEFDYILYRSASSAPGLHICLYATLLALGAYVLSSDGLDRELAMISKAAPAKYQSDLAGLKSVIVWAMMGAAAVRVLALSFILKAKTRPQGGAAFWKSRSAQ